MMFCDDFCRSRSTVELPETLEPLKSLRKNVKLVRYCTYISNISCSYHDFTPTFPRTAALLKVNKLNKSSHEGKGHVLPHLHIIKGTVPQQGSM
jgi:hypothetical protein